MEAEVVALEITEMLAEVPKSLQSPRPKLTPTKETVKDKKGKKPATSVHASLRRNPLKPTSQEKGKVIKLDLEEEDIEDIRMDNEDVGVDVEEVETQGADPITRLSEHVPPQKPKTKVPKDIHEIKTPLQTPLLLDEISFDGPHLARVPLLKLED